MTRILTGIDRYQQQPQIIKDMTTTDTPAFICIICARVVREAHVPPAAPQCPSCGANTRPNAAMRAKAGNVRCMHCDHVEPAYQNDRCPKCDTVYVTFATRQGPR